MEEHVGQALWVLGLWQELSSAHTEHLIDTAPPQLSWPPLMKSPPINCTHPSKMPPLTPVIHIVAVSPSLSFTPLAPVAPVAPVFHGIVRLF